MKKDESDPVGRFLVGAGAAAMLGLAALFGSGERSDVGRDGDEARPGAAAAVVQQLDSVGNRAW